MTERNEVSSAFRAVVLEWLRKEHPEAVAIEGFETYGTDWAGDTFGGFHSEFEFTIRYACSDGGTERVEVKGEDMASLWTHVMRSWPEGSS